LELKRFRLAGAGPPLSLRAEITHALAWSLPAGFTAFGPYLYVVFLTILLTDRDTREDRRCQGKNGAF